MNDLFFLILIFFVFVVFSLLILRKFFTPRIRTIREEIKGLENLPSEKVLKIKEKLKRSKNLQNKIIMEMLRRIRKEKPDISNEELSERVMIEFEREKFKYPELKHSSLKDFKISRSESSIKKE